jgi:hypothetical protein
MLQRGGERSLEFVFKLVAARKEQGVVVNEIEELGGVKITPENVFILQAGTDSWLAMNMWECFPG